MITEKNFFFQPGLALLLIALSIVLLDENNSFYDYLTIGQSYAQGSNEINSTTNLPDSLNAITDQNFLDNNFNNNSILNLLDLSRLFENVEKSVVQITGEPKNLTAGLMQPMVIGSGFVIDKQGHIITNNHVVAAATDYDVTFLDGSIYKAKVIGSDPYSDLAILKVEEVSLEKLIPLQLGNSSDLKVGQRVVAIGNPFGLSGSMTEGIISGLGRSLPSSPTNPNQLILEENPPIFSIPDMIQTDAAINPGNSGGPLLNINGEVIGINTAIFSNTGFYSGVGFAVPSDMIKKIIPSLISNGTYQHPYIGIVGTDVDPEIAELLGLNESKGFLITEVTADGPADRAGLRGGDKITQINGNEIEIGGDVIIGIDNVTVRKIDDLLSYLEGQKSVGDIVQLTFIRNGEINKLNLTLDARPTIGESVPTQQPSLGISGTNMSPEIANRMNITNTTGFLVIDIIADGPADEAGLRGGYKTALINGTEIEIGGDVIIGIDDSKVDTIDDIQRHLLSKQIGDKVKLDIVRDGQIKEIEVTLGQQNQTTTQPLPTPLEPPNTFGDIFNDMYENCLQILDQETCDFMFRN